jgi:hypothetical protein
MTRPLRLLVCGGRDFTDQALFDAWLNTWLDVIGADAILVIHGGSPGADEMAGAWAQAHGATCEVFPADWDAHGKAAGPIRNQQMLERKPDIVLAFPGGKGTADMVARARAAGVMVAEMKP